MIYVTRLEIAGFKPAAEKDVLDGIVTLVSDTARVSIALSLRDDGTRCETRLHRRGVSAALRAARRMPEFRTGAGLAFSPDVLRRAPALFKAA